MNFIKKYIEYLKDNPEGYWFKRKVFGWGWTPATWQGWLVTFIFVAVIVSFSFTIDETSPSNEVFATLLLPLIVLTGLLIRISYKKGEKPRWQWGFPKDDEKKDDNNDDNGDETNYN